MQKLLLHVPDNFLLSWCVCVCVHRGTLPFSLPARIRFLLTITRPSRNLLLVVQARFMVVQPSSWSAAAITQILDATNTPHDVSRETR
jgi:hypothetical protein